MMNERLAQKLRERGTGERVAERVLRLNPDPKPGCRLRGLPPPSFSEMCCMTGAIGKGEFIRRKGRGAWNALPKWAVHRHGRRAYVTREDFEDNVWLSPPTHDLHKSNTVAFASHLKT